MYEKYKIHFPTQIFRTGYADDSDPDKESDFYILKNTICPFVLPENLFFDYRRDADILLSKAGKQGIANAILETIVDVDRNKLIG
jgi:N-acetylmuramoyl-L-alanine amidase